MTSLEQNRLEKRRIEFQNNELMYLTYKSFNDKHMKIIYTI